MGPGPNKLTSLGYSQFNKKLYIGFLRPGLKKPAKCRWCHFKITSNIGQRNSFLKIGFGVGEYLIDHLNIPIDQIGARTFTVGQAAPPVDLRNEIEYIQQFNDLIKIVHSAQPLYIGNNFPALARTQLIAQGRIVQ